MRLFFTIFSISRIGMFKSKLPSEHKKNGIPAQERIGVIAGIIDTGLIVPPGMSPLTSLLRRFMYPGFIKQVHDAGKDFITDEKCTSCGICSRVCPVQNIVMENENRHGRIAANSSLPVCISARLQ